MNGKGTEDSDKLPLALRHLQIREIIHPRPGLSAVMAFEGRGSFFRGLGVR